MDVAQELENRSTETITGTQRIRPAGHTTVSNRRHIEQDLELPVPLVAFAFLLIMTASALFLGHNGRPEAIAICATWILTCAGLILRRPGG